MTTLSTNASLTPEASELRLDTLSEASALLVDGGPPALREVRAEALRRLGELGLPQRTDEEWRYTNPKKIVETVYEITGSPGTIDRAALDEAAVTLENAIRLVFVDGVYSADLSDVGELPAGALVEPLEDAMESEPEALAASLRASLDNARDGFEVIGAGLATCGALVRIDKNVRIERPIVLTFVKTERETPLLTAPHVIVQAGESAEAMIVEDHCAIGDARGLTCGYTTVEAGANAHIEHALLERESRSAFHVSTLHSRQERDTDLLSHRMVLGGAIVRNNIMPILAGPNAISTLNGLYLGEDRQHLDNHMRVVHESPDCPSRQYYRGILGGRARGVFTGRIWVAQEAQRTDAVQSNDILLVSPTAHSTSKPQLEIYADDVKCTHGATTGRLDHDALFYLRSRGMDRKRAAMLLVRAFATEILERITHDGLRERMGRDVDARLDGMIDETIASLF